MGVTSSDEKANAPQWGSPPTPSQLSSLQQQMQKTGLEVSNYFHHPTFGTLLQGELVRPSRQANMTDRRVPVHIKEFSVVGEQNATLIYQYLVRQEQTENPSFPRVYVHLIQPANSQNDPYNKPFDVKVVFEQLNSSLRNAIQERIGKNLYFDEVGLLQIANSTARGLSEIHDQSLSHEDISPDSYILSSRDKFKLYHPLVLQNISTNQRNAIAGRKSYASPEAMKDLLQRHANGYEKSPPTSKQNKSTYNKTTSDLFSLGLTLLEAATLEPEGSYYGRNGDLDVGLLRKKLRKVAHVYSRDFVTLLSKLLAIDPEERSDLYDLIRATNRLKEQAQLKADSQKEKSKQKMPKIWDNEPSHTQVTQSTIKSPQSGWNKQDLVTPPGPFDRSLNQSQPRQSSIQRPQTSRSRVNAPELEYSSVKAPNSARAALHQNPSFAPAEINKLDYQVPAERSRSRSHPKPSPQRYNSARKDEYDYDPDPKSDAIKIIERNNQLAREKERADRSRNSYRTARPSSQTRPQHRDNLLDESTDWNPNTNHPMATETKPRRYDSADRRPPKVEVVTKVKEITPHIDDHRLERPAPRPQYDPHYAISNRPSYKTPARPPTDVGPASRPPRPSRITPRGVEIVLDGPAKPFDSESDSYSMQASSNLGRYRSKPREPTHFMDDEEYSSDAIEEGVPKYIRVRHYEHGRDGTRKLLNEEEKVFDSQFSLDNEETIKEIWKLQRENTKMAPAHPPSKTISTQTPTVPTQNFPSPTATQQVQTSPFNTNNTAFQSMPFDQPGPLLPPGAKFFIAAPAGLDPNLPPLPLFSLDPPLPPPKPTIQQLPNPATYPQPRAPSNQPNPNQAPPRQSTTLGGDPVPRHTRSSHISSVVVGMPPPLPVIVTERPPSPSPEPKVTRVTKPPVVRRDLSKNIDDPIAQSYHGYTVGQIVERKYLLQPDNGEILEEVLRKVQTGVRREKKAVVDASGLLLAPAANVDMNAPVQGTSKLLKDCIKRYPQNGFQPSMNGPPRTLETSSIFHGNPNDAGKTDVSPFFLESMEQDKFEQFQKQQTPDGSASPRFANSNQNSKPNIPIPANQNSPPPPRPKAVPQNSPPPVIQNTLQVPGPQAAPPAQPPQKEPLRLRFQRINGKDIPVGIDNPGMSDQEKRTILEMYMKKEGVPPTLVDQLLGPNKTQAQPPSNQPAQLAMPPTPPIVVSPSGQPSPGTTTRVFRPADVTQAPSPPPQSFTTVAANAQNSRPPQVGQNNMNRQPANNPNPQYQPSSNQPSTYQNSGQKQNTPPPMSLADESFDGGKSYFSNMKNYETNGDFGSPNGQENRGPSLIDEIQRKPYESNSSLSGQSIPPGPAPDRGQQGANIQRVQYSQQPQSSNIGFAGQGSSQQPYGGQQSAIRNDPSSQARFLAPTQSPAQQLNNTTFYGARQNPPPIQQPQPQQQIQIQQPQRDRSPSPPTQSNSPGLRSASPPNLQKQSSGKPVQQLAKLSSTKKAQRQFQQQMGTSGMLGEIEEDEDFMAAPEEDLFQSPSQTSQSYQRTIEGSKLQRDAQARDAFGFESSASSAQANNRGAYNPGFDQRNQGYTDLNFESQFIDQSGRSGGQGQPAQVGFSAFQDQNSGFSSNSGNGNRPQIMVTPPSPRVAAPRNQMGNSTVRVSTAPQVKNSSISAANRAPVGFSAFGSVTSSMGQGLGEDAFGDFEDDGFGAGAQTQDQWQMASYRAGRESTF